MTLHLLLLIPNSIKYFKISDPDNSSQYKSNGSNEMHPEKYGHEL